MISKNKKRRKRQAVPEDDGDQEPQLFENLPDSSHMKNGSPVVLQERPNGWSIKGLGKGQRPRSAKQIVTTYEIVDWADVPESVKHHFRRRSEARKALLAGKGEIDKKKKTCMLYLQADHLFYEAMGSDQEACIEAMTRHVQRVNSIYEPIDFDGDGKGDSIRFMIKRIKVHTEKALEDKSYRFPGNYGVEKFLEIFSGKSLVQQCVLITFLHAAEGFHNFYSNTRFLVFKSDFSTFRGRLRRLLLSLHVHLPRLRRRNSGPGVDG